MTETFTDNTAKSRFELQVGHAVAYADYRRDNGVLFIDYVEAPQELRGTGAAGRLMQHVVEAAKRENLSITPICGYAATWLSRNAK